MMKLKVFSFSAVFYFHQYITSIGLFYKNWGCYLEGVWLLAQFGEAFLKEMGTKVAQVWNLTKSKTAVIHW